MSAPRTLWDEGRAPGHEVIALGIAVALTAAAGDLMLTSGVGLLFDLSFVVLCAALALMVRPRDFFSVGVLPPLLMLGVFGLLAVSRSGAIARADDSPVQAVISGLSAHSGALVTGYLLCLTLLFVRQRVARQRVTPSEGLSRTDPGRRLPV